MKISEELESEILQLRKELEEKTKRLIFEEARSQSPYKVGDIIQDHYQIGEIEKVIVVTNQVNLTFDFVYNCKKLKKDLKPFKSGESCRIYLMNVEQKLN